MSSVSETSKSMVLCQVSGPGFDPSFLRAVPNLQRLSLIHSNISYFTLSFPFHQNLQELNLTHLQLTEVHIDKFLKLKALKVLDLSYNQLKTLGKMELKRFSQYQKIYLRGNPWDCDSDLSWVLNTKNSSPVKKIVDLEEMTCGPDSFPDKPVVGVFKFITSVEENCPWRCLCQLVNVVWSQDDLAHLVPIVVTNCSSQGLTEMPSRLPPNTTTLHLENNHISDLSPIIYNRRYWTVSDIYLDNNKIEYIDNLEDAKWLQDFRVLSLRGNHLKKFSTEAFNAALDKNYHVAKLYLGNNPWYCDCYFIPDFKELVIKYRVIIGDISDIRCTENSNTATSLKLVSEVHVGVACRDMWEGLSPLGVVNLTLGSLLLLLLAKFSYDCWLYKTTGQLPWIVMKLP